MNKGPKEEIGPSSQKTVTVFINWAGQRSVWSLHPKVLVDWMDHHMKTEFLSLAPQAVEIFGVLGRLYFCLFILLWNKVVNLHMDVVKRTAFKEMRDQTNCMLLSVYSLDQCLLCLDYSRAGIWWLIVCCGELCKQQSCRSGKDWGSPLSIVIEQCILWRCLFNSHHGWQCCWEVK